MLKISRAVKSYIESYSGGGRSNFLARQVFPGICNFISLFNKRSFVLYMTLLVKNEEDIIRENILFHRALGVDGFIVTDNNSTDNTVKILEELKKDGIPIEIIHEPEVTYYQDVWVDRMIKIARDKYKADWVINADADEFWYSVSLDLKQDISRYGKKCNVLQTFLVNFHPLENRKDFLKSCYFIKRSLRPFEMEELGITTNRFGDACFRSKVIHKTKGYKQIFMGNHRVQMKNKKEKFCPYIKPYHYLVRNYEHFEQKVIKGGRAFENYPDKVKGEHWRRWYAMYQQGKLKEAYEKEFAINSLDKLTDYGIVARDNSVYNYLKHIKVITD